MRTSKTISTILGFLLSVFIVNFSSAQKPGWTCETPEPKKDYLASKGITNYAVNFNPRNVNIFVHIIRRSNGTGGLTAAEVNNSLVILRNDFQSADICFTEIGRSFINNDTYFNFNGGLFNGLIGVNPHANAIDVYLLPAGVPFGGRASGIPGIALVLGGDYAETSVLSHEMGHCLGLYHTHSGRGCGDFVNCAEAIDGSNCSSCGDLVCDTPADPCLSGNVNAACSYTGGGGFTPDVSNIQSYTRPACMDHFTSGQFSRIHTMITNNQLLLNTLNNNPCSNCYDNLVINSPVTGSTNFKVSDWIIASSTISSNINVKMHAGNRIHLISGFKFIAGQNGRFEAEILACRRGLDQNPELADEISEYTPPIQKQKYAENLEKNELKVFPNPARDKINIEYNFDENTQYLVRIFDLTGKIVIDQKVSNEVSTIDLDRLENGAYLLTLYDSKSIPKPYLIKVDK